MCTSYGRYRWLCLPFGITSAPEEFQMRLRTALEGLEGIVCIATDILLVGEGADFAEPEKDDDRRFIALMERYHQRNIKLNAPKLQLKLRGQIHGNYHHWPTNETRSRQGSGHNTNARTTEQGSTSSIHPVWLIPLTVLCKPEREIQPLRLLTQDAVPFVWSEAQDRAFNRAKRLISSAPVLAYYDLHKPVVLQTNASDNAIGGADSRIIVNKMVEIKSSIMYHRCLFNKRGLSRTCYF